jgi:hypothetical protein
MRAGMSSSSIYCSQRDTWHCPDAPFTGTCRQRPAKLFYSSRLLQKGLIPVNTWWFRMVIVETPKRDDDRADRPSLAIGGLRPYPPGKKQWEPNRLKPEPRDGGLPPARNRQEAMGTESVEAHGQSNASGVRVRTKCYELVQVFGSLAEHYCSGAR